MQIVAIIFALTLTLQPQAHTARSRARYDPDAVERHLVRLAAPSAHFYESYCGGVREQVRGANLGVGTILVVSWYNADAPTVHYSYFLTADGHGGWIRRVYDWAGQGGGEPNAGDAQTAKAAALIQRLPETQSRVAVHRLAVVSFYRGDEWVTASYDRKTLPRQLLAALRAVGAIHTVSDLAASN